MKKWRLNSPFFVIPVIKIACSCMVGSNPWVMGTLTEHIKIEYEERKRGKVAILTLDGIAPNNTLNLEILNGFIDALYKAGEEADGVLVTSANEKFFSNGLDGATLLAADKQTRQSTITAMIKAYGKMIGFGKPWIVEINGFAWPAAR